MIRKQRRLATKAEKPHSLVTIYRYWHWMSKFLLH